MPEHIREDGKQIIDGLKTLGKALGYYVDTELSVEKYKTNPQAVDVAWLSEKGQEFPLMIFEVESSVTNAVINNPAKVFGQPNQTFEKPLFFFHVMVTGGQESSRIDNLRNLFGLHNYRVYRLQNDETLQLVKDILSQHRRLTNRLDLDAVLSALDKNPWNMLGLDSILLHIESIAFERGRGTYLPRYAALSQRDVRFQQHFVRYLFARENTIPLTPEDDDYQTYLGSQWSIPIHLGILVASASGEERIKFFGRLKQWQEHTWYMTQIGPHFGLSRDYDEFILGLAPPLWALTAILMRELPEAIGYIATQCKNILEKLKDASPEVSFFTATWMLHMASVNDAAIECYEFARKFINERGGIPVCSMYQPIGQLSLDKSNAWISEDGEPYEQVPAIQEFRKVLGVSTPEVKDLKTESISLALEALINDNVIFDWAPRLIRLLQGR